jgi:uncharacterized membrane protein YqgA involved in biofilm formation
MKELGDKVHTRLKRRIVLFLGISVVMTGISIFHVIREWISILYTILGLSIGLVIGLSVARIFKISWDKKAKQVISKFDTIGIIILVLYLAFEIFRTKIVGYFVNRHSVFAVSFAILAGVMYGRFLGIRGKIRQIFEEEGITP